MTTDWRDDYRRNCHRVPRIYGVKYEVTNNALLGRYHIGALFTIIVIESTAGSVTLGTQIGGGVFFGSLHIGAMTSDTFGLVTRRHSPIKPPIMDFTPWSERYPSPEPFWARPSAQYLWYLSSRTIPMPLSQCRHGHVTGDGHEQLACDIFLWIELFFLSL